MLPLRSSRCRSAGTSPAAWVAVTGLGVVAACPWVALAIGLAALFMLLSGWGMRLFHQRLAREALLQLDLAGVDAMDPLVFEAFVAHLLTAQGFRTELTQASHDYGVDVVASSGTRRIAVQVKRYSRPVSNAAIAEVVMGMPHHGCSECMVVTNSTFTRPAVQSAAPHPCTLVDRLELARWLAHARKASQ